MLLLREVDFSQHLESVVFASLNFFCLARIRLEENRKVLAEENFDKFELQLEDSLDKFVIS